MKTSLKISITTASILTSFLLAGCGSDGANTITPSTNAPTTFAGQLVDSYVQNVDYSCDDGAQGITDVNGRFECDSLPIEFKLNGLRLGKISTLAQDSQVFPQDLLGLDRKDTKHPEVVAMARFLQSCDEDNNSQNGLQIHQRIKDSLFANEDFNGANIESYIDITVDETDAVEHLEQTTQLIESVNTATTLPPAVIEAILTPMSVLTQEAKNTLSYMGNEERLAYDVYMKLYESYPLQQFINIATNGETPHIQAVQLLIQKYISSYDEFTNIDLPELGYKETEVEDMQGGIYDISAIQNLYDALMAKGLQSQQDALEVACMVEVTDIYDLDHDIAIAEASNAADVVTTFEFLRDGSYSHYWAFDSGLKSMGITEGCCVLGTIDGVNYCHNEYPQNQNGGNGSGQKKGKH